MPINVDLSTVPEKRRVQEIAQDLGLDPAVILPHGHYIAKVPVSELDDRSAEADGELILVTAMSPTPSGEGKTTTTIGLGDALRLAGHKTALCLREPSLGPYFGMKGGGTGTGLAQLHPQLFQCERDLSTVRCEPVVAIDQDGSSCCGPSLTVSATSCPWESSRVWSSGSEISAQ